MHLLHYVFDFAQVQLRTTETKKDKIKTISIKVRSTKVRYGFSVFLGIQLLLNDRQIALMKLMIKKLLPVLSLTIILFIPLLPKPAQAGEALCVIKGSSNEVLFSDKCNFNQFAGNGSFWIEAKSGLIAGRESISVAITQPGVAEVRGLTTDGINSRWGEATRSTSDKACWVGSDFTICAY